MSDLIRDEMAAATIAAITDFIIQNPDKFTLNLPSSHLDLNSQLKKLFVDQLRNNSIPIFSDSGISSSDEQQAKKRQREHDSCYLRETVLDHDYDAMNVDSHSFYQRTPNEDQFLQLSIDYSDSDDSSIAYSNSALSQAETDVNEDDKSHDMQISTTSLSKHCGICGNVDITNPVNVNGSDEARLGEHIADKMDEVWRVNHETLAPLVLSTPVQIGEKGLLWYCHRDVKITLPATNSSKKKLGFKVGNIEGQTKRGQHYTTQRAHNVDMSRLTSVRYEYINSYHGESKLYDDCLFSQSHSCTSMPFATSSCVKLPPEIKKTIFDRIRSYSEDFEDSEKALKVFTLPIRKGVENPFTLEKCDFWILYDPEKIVVAPKAKQRTNKVQYSPASLDVGNSSVHTPFFTTLASTDMVAGFGANGSQFDSETSSEASTGDSDSDGELADTEFDTDESSSNGSSDDEEVDLIEINCSRVPTQQIDNRDVVEITVYDIHQSDDEPLEKHITSCVMEGQSNKHVEANVDKTESLELQTGREKKRFEGQTDWVNSVACSFEGSMIASISDDCSVRLWDAALAKQFQQLDKPTQTVYSVAFSRNGKLIASASRDKTVCLWNAPSSLQTPTILLKAACFAGDLDSAKFQLDQGALVNNKAHDGKTALHQAIIGNHASIVQLLLQRGADINIADDSNRSALQLANQSKSAEIKATFNQATSLQNKNLKSIPASALNKTSQFTLRLGNNKLGPDVWDTLTSSSTSIQLLVGLFLQSNPSLGTIPDSVAKLGQLLCLSVADCDLAASSIRALVLWSNLRSLDVSCNTLGDLPAEFSEFKELGILNLNKCHLSFAVCYRSRVHDADLRTRLFDVWDHSFKKFIEDEERAYINLMTLDPSVAKNAALREMVFVTMVCIYNRIPLFIVDHPGTGKSLTLSILHASCLGKDSSNNFLGRLPALSIVPYQGSKSSTSEGILKVFKKAQETKLSDDVLPVVLLDEIGLAEVSPHNPLTVLHALLEPPTGKCPNVSVAGISNFALDPAKMSRAIHLSRRKMTKEDLIETTRTIFTAELSESDLKAKDTRNLEHLADSYFKYIGAPVVLAIVQLLQLRDLGISNNSIHRIPIALASLSYLTRITLSGCPLTVISSEYHNAPTSQLLQFLKDLGQQSKPVYRSKLLLVGYGRVGKTTLLSALFPLSATLLKKISDMMKSMECNPWEQRRCKIEGSKLICYRPSISGGWEKADEIELVGAMIEADETDQVSWFIQPKGPSRKYEFRCQTGLEREEWINACKFQALNRATDGITVMYRDINHADLQSAFDQGYVAPANWENANRVPGYTTLNRAREEANPMPTYFTLQALNRVPENPTLQLALCDFAGQHEYQDGHQLFLTSRSVYLVLWDVTPTKRAAELAKLRHRLVTLQPQLGSDQLRNSVLIYIVGTHADAPDVDLDQCAEQATKVIEAVQFRVPYRLIPGIDVRNQQHVSSLKQQLLADLAVQAHLGEEVPTSYLDLEQKIRLAQDNCRLQSVQHDDLTIIPIPLLQRINLASQRKVDVDLVTRDLWGQIVYFGRDSNKQRHVFLDEFVVYAPEWLTDSVLGSIVQLVRQQKEKFKKNNSSSRYEPIVLHRDLIKLSSVWQNTPSHPHDHVMEMLYSLDLGFAVSPTSDQSKPFVERSSFFPQLLAFSLPQLLTWQPITSTTTEAPLNYAVSDAAAVRNRLKELGFEKTVHVFDGTKQQICEAIQEFESVVYEFAQAGNEHDVLFVLFYSGHACQENGVNLFVTSDNQSISLKDVFSKLEMINNTFSESIFTAVMLDARCFSDFSESASFDDLQANLAYLFVDAYISGQAASDGCLLAGSGPLATAILNFAAYSTIHKVQDNSRCLSILVANGSNFFNHFF